MSLFIPASMGEVVLFLKNILLRFEFLHLKLIRFNFPFKSDFLSMHNEALSAQREPWISHTDVNLKMRKKRVMVPLGSDGLFHRFSGKNTPRTHFRFV